MNSVGVNLKRRERRWKLRALDYFYIAMISVAIGLIVVKAKKLNEPRPLYYDSLATPTE